MALGWQVKTPAAHFSSFSASLVACSIWSCSAPGTPASTSRSLSLRPSPSSSSLAATVTLCPFEPGNGSHHSDSGAESSTASFGSISGSPVNSRLACARSDIVTLYVKRPSITASSAARACTIFGVTLRCWQNFRSRHLLSMDSFSWLLSGKYVLYFAVKTVSAHAGAFLKQMFLRPQPMLHFMPEPAPAPNS
jgi:hypothetical protein